MADENCNIEKWEANLGLTETTICAFEADDLTSQLVLKSPESAKLDILYFKYANIQLWVIGDQMVHPFYIQEN